MRAALIRISEREGRPHVDGLSIGDRVIVVARMLRACRHHAHHGEGLLVEHDGPADNAGVCRKAGTPQAIADNRTAIRQRLTNFLTPDQLSKWDAEVGKAKEFLGQKLAA